MTHITLEEAKEQLQIELENTEHDSQISRLIAAAEAWARKFLNVTTLEDFLDSPWVDSPPESPGGLPEDLKSGILLKLESLFDRDAQQMEQLEKSAIDMVWPYRQNVGV